ncbi:MAG: hypothetical protein ATN35_12120 [Epulopiscium sp. Nele67-Bin004]|nr:MAG: hypothetical protein ATN35_12120 [Epulopiscium sp. Nele67-Bin004]
MRENYLFIGDRLNTLKQEIKTERSEVFKRLYEVCRLHKTEILEDTHPNKSITFMGMASINLSLNYLLTEQKHYLEEAKRWVFTVASYPHWGNKHMLDVDLSASWVLFGLALAYDWLKDSLTDEERKILKDKLILQSTRMYDFKLTGQKWSFKYWQNHNWINLAGLAAAGYALKGEHADAQLWTDCAKANFEKVYDYLADDGSNYEGVAYWRYGVLWLCVYADLLNKEEGINYFEKSNFMRETFYYRLYQAAPNLEEIIMFGDTHDKRSGHSAAMYYKFAAEYNNGYAQYLGNKVMNNFMFREAYESKIRPGIMPEAGLELLWYEPAIEEKKFDDLPLVKYFEDLGLVVIRSSWEENAVLFAFKCGAAGGKKQWEKSWELQKEKGILSRSLSHHHADNNSFIIHGYDTFLAIDEGYSREVRAKDHSVIIVDGLGYRDENKPNIWDKSEEHHTAEMLSFMSENGITYFAGDAHRVYLDELELTKSIRHVVHTGKEHFFIIDELDSTLEHTYTFQLQAETDPETIGEGVFEYLNGPGRMKVYSDIGVDNDLQVRHEQTHVRAIMTPQEPDKFREVYMETLCLENANKHKQVEFINVLAISDALEEDTLTAKRVQQGVTHGYEVSVDGRKETVLFARDSKIEYGDIKADAKIVLVIEENGQVDTKVLCK